MSRRTAGARKLFDGDAERLRELEVRLGEDWPEAAAELGERHDALAARLGATGLGHFVAEGLGLAEERGAAAAAAFFRLESRTAQEAIARLEGRLRLDDWLGVLRLYAEAVAGAPVELGESVAADPVDGHRGAVESTPGTDGLRLLLPGEVMRIRGTKTALAPFKLGILHQIGRYRSGTFAFDLAILERLRPELAPLLRRVDTSRATSFGRFFSAFARPALARRIFEILDGARVDTWVAARFAGARVDLAAVREHILARRPGLALLAPGWAALEALVRWSLGDDPRRHAPRRLAPIIGSLVKAAGPCASMEATVYTVADCTLQVFTLLDRAGLGLPFVLDQDADAVAEAEVENGATEGETMRVVPVLHRGTMEPEEVQARLELRALRSQLEEEDPKSPPSAGVLALLEEAMGDSLGALGLQDGDLFAASGLLQCAEDGGPISGMPAEGEGGEPSEQAERMGELVRELAAGSRASSGVIETGREAFFYDEWDHEIGDYRRRWCRLTETVLEEGERSFVDDALQRHGELLERVRRQFQLLEPELRRPVRGLVDGEELDLDAAIGALLDRQAGRSPSEKVYVRRQRIERDVATVFLLDLSASTDSEVETAAPPPADSGSGAVTPEFVGVLDEDPMWLYGAGTVPEPKRRVIDVEKEALVLMAEALETLGDAYAVYGFSGFGRLQVDFFVAKEFSDPFDVETQRRIAAMRPRQSTRMGPAIRHALSKLSAQEARLKTLLILSDGYPQDHDYGRLRASREYGILDTMMALREAQLRGVHTFCITVDPAGHDYLRAMCPDERYLVIDDIAALPDELPKVYRALTT